MSPLNPRIQEAIALRQQGQYQASRDLLKDLLDHPDEGAQAHLQTAWAYDNEGLEQQALTHYFAALSDATLSTSDRFETLFGLASTYRCLGQYATALAYFEQLLREYPAEVQVQPFYAMCLYNVGRHKEATSLLLKLLVSTTNSEAIQGYQRAILGYAEDLDRQW